VHLRGLDSYLICNETYESVVASRCFPHRLFVCTKIKSSLQNYFLISILLHLL
ncbi:hypothetical protein L9F63_003508, partial [Diploptera punctata]